MSESYRVFVEEESIAILLTISKRKRQLLLGFLQTLARDPFTEADFPETDNTGRKCFCKIIDEWAISYYADHAVKEVKVFEITLADT